MRQPLNQNYLGTSMRIHENYINDHYSPVQSRKHFDSYDYCMAKLIDCAWDTRRCPREWAIVSEHDRRVRDER